MADKNKISNDSLLTQIKESLSSTEITLVETALQQLGKFVDKNSTHDYNPLAEYFGEKSSNDTIVSIPFLDKAFEKFKSELSTETILSLVKMSLKSVSQDNYNIAILSIQEIIKRKNEKAQKKVVQLFNKACAFYDFGHRYRAETVLDQLYDRLFKEFECGALLSLFKDKSMDMFSPQDGDGADHLFGAAFSKCEKSTDFKKLVLSFFLYKKERISSLSSAYFTDLQNKITDRLGEKQKKEFEKEIDLKEKEYRIFDLLASEQKEDIIELIGEIGKKERSKFVYEDGGLISDKILSRDDLSKNELISALNGFVKQKEKGCTIDLSFRLLQKYGQEECFQYFKSIQSKGNTNDIFFVLRGIINKLNDKSTSWTELKLWFEFAQNFIVDVDDESNLFSEYIVLSCTQIIENKTYDESFYAQIEHLNEIINLIKNPSIEIYHLNLNKGLTTLTDRDEEKSWKVITIICHCLFKIMFEAQIFRSFQIAINASVKTHNIESLNILESYFPKDLAKSKLEYNPSSAFEIVIEMLAFGLACAYALFSEKEKMIQYIEISIKAGKSPNKFLENSDFKNYWKDKDFLAVIA